MTTAQNYDIVGSFNNQRFSSIDAERTVNCFEYIDPNSKKLKSLIPTSGIKDSGVAFTGNTGAFRAQFVFNNDMYMVIGNTAYKVNSSLGLTVLGTLNTTTGYVGVDANSYQVIFVDGLNGYIWDTNGNFWTTITDTSFPAAPLDVAFLDGFFVVINGGTNNLQLCEFNQGMVWGEGTSTFTGSSVTSELTIAAGTANYATGVPVTLTTSGGGTLPSPLTTTDTYYCIKVDASTIKLATSYTNAITNVPITLTTNSTPTCTIEVVGQLQLASVTSHPGTLVAVNTLHRRLFLFSQNFTEVWENAGIGTNLPFRRNNSLLMEVGTPSTASVAVGFDRMFFLSQDRDGLGSVVEVVGTQSAPVSTRALDYQLAQYAANPDVGVADAKGILIKENGLIFYRLNFTAANHTYVYNVTMSDPQNQRWHEEETLDGSRHPGQTHVYFNGVNYYGDYAKATLYIVDSTLNTNNGETIRRMRIGKPFVPPGYNRMRIDRFHLDLLQGDVTNTDVLYVAQDLLTEDSQILLTEAGLDIITEQEQAQVTYDQPYVFLSISKDGGQTYGNRIKAPMGKVGERTYRTVWRKLGTIPRGQAFVPKIEFFNQVPFVVLGAAWVFEVMPE